VFVDLKLNCICNKMPSLDVFSKKFSFEPMRPLNCVFYIFNNYKSWYDLFMAKKIPTNIAVSP
jgi:hypothetical protein